MRELPYTPKVKNRSELRSVLERCLLAEETEPLVDTQADQEDSERGTVKPKTYLIESNADLTMIRMNGHRLEPSEDKTLWNLLCSDGQFPFVLYLDTLDKRYWMLHSIYFARKSDETVDSLVLTNGNHLDYVWLSSDSLENLSKGKPSMGFGLSHSNLFALGEDKLGVSMRYWGGEVPSILIGLRGIDPLRNQISLSSIGIKHRTAAGYTKEDIFQNGKLTAKSGNSIDSHFDLINTVEKYYANIISEIEQNYTVKYQYSEHYCTIQGTYSVIRFSTPLQNLQSFAEILSSGNEPFRIWGIWRTINNMHIKINGVDLHTNTPVELELMPDGIRINLRDGLCGNVVTRLLTNIQAGFDSGCRLKGVDDANIIRPYITP